MKSLIRVAIAGALTGAASVASAAAFTFSGNLPFHNSVVRVGFSLASDATNVRMWTDSFNGGVNFDPITALWRRADGDFVLLEEDDDNDTVGPGQTYYDSGFAFSELAAGNYLFTVAAFPNFSAGTLLSDGFVFDDQTPIPIPLWDQPARGDQPQTGTFWRVNLTGVDTAAVVPGGQVPLPSSLALLSAALLGLGATVRRRRQTSAS